MTTARVLTVLGLTGAVLGTVLAATGTVVPGVTAAGIGVLLLLVATLVGPASPEDAEAGLEQERAETQRLVNDTAAAVEDREERPPPTGA